MAGSDDCDSQHSVKLIKGGKILNQAELTSDYEALQKEFDDTTQRMEQYTKQTKSKKGKTKKEVELIAPSVVTMPNHEELNALLEANDLLKAKVFKQQSAITSIINRRGHKTISKVIEDATVRLYNKKEEKKPTTFQTAENMVHRDPPKEINDCHYLISGLRDVILLKDREILSLKLNQQEIEKRVGLEPPMKFREKMNELLTENNEMKVKIKELDREVKTLKLI